MGFFVPLSGSVSQAGSPLGNNIKVVGPIPVWAIHLRWTWWCIWVPSKSEHSVTVCNHTIDLRALANMSVTSSASFPSFLSLLPPCTNLSFLNWPFLCLFQILLRGHLVLLTGQTLCNAQQHQISLCLLSPGTTVVGLLIKIWQVELGIHSQSIAAIKLRSLTSSLIQQTANDQKLNPLVFWITV